MKTKFIKMQGIGNDFVVIDLRHEAFDTCVASVSKICDRRFGVGCDQLVLLDAPTEKGADVFVRFFNPDGSEAGACGNASRCAAALIGGSPVLQTHGGLLPTLVTEHGEIGVDMGQPRLNWEGVPLASAMETLELPLPGKPAACSMGNPHATFFNGIEEAAKIGEGMERNALFPERANIGCVSVISRDAIKLRVWERGAGITLGCGSGACAAVVNGVRRGLINRTCRVEMDGGTLRIVWRKEDDHVLMIGPATRVFEGIWPAQEGHA